MKKFLSFVFILLILIVVVFAVAKNQIVKQVAEFACKKITGLDLNIQKMNVGISNTLIDMQGVELKNPTQYDKYPVMAEVPTIYVDYDLQDIISGKIHLTDVKFHLKNFVVIKNADGTTNLDSLKTLKKDKTGEKPDATKPGEKPNLVIDNLDLQIEKVTFVSYDQSGKATVKEFPIRISEKHENIESFETVVGLIVFKALTKTTIATLTNIDIQMLGNFVSGTVDNAAQAAGDLIKGTTGTAQQTIDASTNTLKNAAKDIGGLLKSPLGQKKDINNTD